MKLDKNKICWTIILSTLCIWGIWQVEKAFAESIVDVQCGIGTELVNGVCQIIQDDLPKSDNMQNNSGFNFFEWLIGLFR